MSLLTVLREAPTAKPGCPEHVIPVVNQYLLSIWRVHPEWLRKLQHQEVFSSLNAFEQRVCACTFLKGFDLV